MEVSVGKITHYFGHVGVAAFKVESADLKVGDTIHIKGHTTDLTQTIESMQIEHQEVAVAKPGQEIGIKVRDHVREHDVVSKVVPD